MYKLSNEIKDYYEDLYAGYLSSDRGKLKVYCIQKAQGKEPKFSVIQSNISDHLAQIHAFFETYEDPNPDLVDLYYFISCSYKECLIDENGEEFEFGFCDMFIKQGLKLLKALERY